MNTRPADRWRQRGCGPLFFLPTRRSAAAFSLVELLMVVALVAITAAIAVPRYATASARYRADAAAKRIVADLEYARSLAVHSSAAKTLDINGAGKWYRIIGVVDLDHPMQEYRVKFDQPPYAGVTFGTIALGATPMQIVFNGYGKADEGGTIEVFGGGTISRLIVIDAATGAINIQ